MMSESKQIRIRIYEDINSLDINIQTLINALLKEYLNNRNLRRKIKTIVVKDDKVYKNDI